MKTKASALVASALLATLPLTGLANTPEPHDVAVHDQTTCIGQATTVIGGGLEERLSACDASMLAREFVAAHGLDSARPVTIEIHYEVIVEWGNHAFSVLGQFDPNADLVQITSRAGHADMAREQPTLGQGYTVPFHRSFVVHEVTHALIDPLFPDTGDHRLAHEYVAYVAQLATMDPATRAEILADFDLPGFDNEAQINGMLYAMSPDAYAVKAYRHYLEAGNGTEFVHFLLDGGLKPAEFE